MKKTHKILCVTSHDLDGPDYGATLRTRNIFRLLAQIGEVRLVLAGRHILPEQKPKPSSGGFEVLKTIPFHPVEKRPLLERLRREFDPRFLHLEWVCASRADRQWLHRALAQHDLVWIHGLYLANGFGFWRWPKSVLDVDDIPSAFFTSIMSQTAGLGKKIRCWRRAALWRRQEKHLAERFEAVCICSEPDRQKLDHSENFFLLPNAFAAPAESSFRQPSAPPRIGFIGTFKYAPNLEGVRWFIERVWPLVLEKIPDARLRLAGEQGQNENWSRHRNVDRLGWVSEMENEMATWSLTIVPIFAGSGTRIKIAEAFSRRCPVVSTSLGAYGYDVADGRELMLADLPQNFAAKCLEILNNASAGRKLADAAWKKFMENWTWELQAPRVAKIVETVLKKNADPDFSRQIGLTK